MAKFIKIDKVIDIMSNNGVFLLREGENRYVYIRPRDVSGVVHRDNMYYDIKDKDTLRLSKSGRCDVTTITRYHGDSVNTFMDTDEVIGMINAALEEEEFKHAELYKK